MVFNPARADQNAARWSSLVPATLPTSLMDAGRSGNEINSYFSTAQADVSFCAFAEDTAAPQPSRTRASVLVGVNGKLLKKEGSPVSCPFHPIEIVATYWAGRLCTGGFLVAGALAVSKAPSFMVITKGLGS